MTKRWSILIGVLVLVLAIAPMDALGQKKKKKKKPPPPPVEQVVEGNVTFPAVFLDTAVTPPEPSCFARVHRTLFLQFGDQAQGYFGWHFEVDPATWGGTFKLEVTGGQSPDLDVTYYTDLGDLTTGAAATQSYETRSTTGEEGDIPANMNHVIVCMFTGLDSSFKYTGIGPAGGAPAPAPSGSPAGSPTPSPTST
ncbi:MAG TPA: hypothetical protein VHJ82_00195 [Actinomycetota bacterium]|nr:hypothetical protein [Actinomycetota bacterium]